MNNEEHAAILTEVKEEMNELLDEKIEELTGENAQDRQSKKVRVMKKIYDEGGTVSKEKFHEIGEEVGYDKRGLGGLFAWKGKGARLQKVEKLNETEIVLTQKGVSYLKRKGVIEEE
jgi:hypothetical protein